MIKEKLCLDLAKNLMINFTLYKILRLNKKELYYIIKDYSKY